MKKTNVLKIKDMAKQRVLNPTTGKEIYVCGQTFNLLVRNGMCYDKTLNRLTNPVVKSIVSQASEVKAKTDVQCERCGKSFKENTKRNKHYRQKVRCAPLLNDTYTAEELVDRGKYVRQEGQFKCEYCNAGYSTPKIASGHQKICKQNPLHPEYKQITVTCGCGNTFLTGSVLAKDLQVEVCSSCHPFFTGKQRVVDTAGRVDKFMKKYAK